MGSIIYKNEPFWVPNDSKNHKCIRHKEQVIYRVSSGKKMMQLQQSENEYFFHSALPIVGFLWNLDIK